MCICLAAWRCCEVLSFDHWCTSCCKPPALSLACATSSLLIGLAIAIAAIIAVVACRSAFSSVWVAALCTASANVADTTAHGRVCKFQLRVWSNDAASRLVKRTIACKLFPGLRPNMPASQICLTGRLRGETM